MRRIIFAILAGSLIVTSTFAQDRPAPMVAPVAEPWLPQSSDDGPTATYREGEFELPRLTARADYLLWWLKDMPLRPVITTGDTTDALPGALGQPTTTVLFPNREVDLGLYSGARIRAAYRFGADELWGVEAGAFFLGSRSSTFSASSDGTFSSKVIGRPFDNLATGQSDVSLTAYPSVASGTVRVTTTARVLGAETDGIVCLFRWRGLRFDLLGGFRYFRLFESLSIQERTNVLPGVPMVGGSDFAGADLFAVSNNFYGGQLGMRAEVRTGRLLFEAQGKLALGGTQEIVNISGLARRQSASGAVEVLPGSLYALSSNIGRRTRGTFAVLPEVGVNLGWQMFDHVQFQLGYTFLYLSRVARAGPQIDTGLNPALIPTSLVYGQGVGAARPGLLERDEGFWVQGVNAGIELRY